MLLGRLLHRLANSGCQAALIQTHFDHLMRVTPAPLDTTERLSRLMAWPVQEHPRETLPCRSRGWKQSSNQAA